MTPPVLLASLLHRDALLYEEVLIVTVLIEEHPASTSPTEPRSNLETGSTR
jgi:hypothetical protein